MKKHNRTIALATIALLSGTLLLTACNNQEEETKESTEQKEQEAPKSKKGNWIEADAKKFMSDVSKAMTTFSGIFGEEKTQEVMECYLDKAIMTFENYDEAESSPEKCKELADACVTEIINPEELYEEVDEKDISEEKLKEVTGNLEELLKDELPKK